MTPAWALLVSGAAILAVAGGIPVLYVALGFLQFAAYHRHKARPLPLGGAALVRVLAREVAAIRRVALDLARALWSRSAERVVDGVPVVLVHGYLGHASNFLRLAERLADHDRKTMRVRLGRPLRTLDAYALRLGASIDAALAHASADHIDVVCHSMGGLVLRVLFAARPDLAARARVVITLGTPHQGTAATRLVGIGADVRAMRRRSELLRVLPSLVELCPAAHVVMAAALIDFVVYPRETCFAPGAIAHTFGRVGHAGLLVQDEVLDFVTEHLTSLSATGARD